MRGAKTLRVTVTFHTKPMYILVQHRNDKACIKFMLKMLSFHNASDVRDQYPSLEEQTYFFVYNY